MRPDGGKTALTVLSVAYALAPVGPDAVGGAEQILSAVDRALVAAGHRSVVVACSGSKVAGTLIDTGPVPANIDDEARRSAVAATRDAVRQAMTGTDVIHLHGLDFAEVLPADGPPALVTLHLPTDWYTRLETSRPHTFLHGVSAAQTRGCQVALMPPIENGIPVDALEGLRPARRDFALVLGRICPEKGQHLALEATSRAGIGLAIAGSVFGYPAHREYFETQVAPRLDRRRRYLGPVGFERKRFLLSAARCLLVPSLAEETSSLVAMEAAACGTPVIAFGCGALPDIVEHGRTGFIVQGVEQMAEAIGRTRDIDPDECRRVAKARFSVERMTDRYLQRFRDIP